MGSWIRKWHVVLAVVLGIYLAIPKSTDAITQFGKSYTFPTGTSFTAEGGEEFSLRKSVEAYQEDGFYVFSGGDVQMKKEKPEDRDFPKPPSTLRVPYSESIANLIQTQDSFELKWPFARFKPNLGQDLAGGTSLRYKISSGDVADAQQRMLELYSSQKFSAGQVPENVLAKKNAYLAAVDRASLPDRPGDEYLLTDEEIESLKGAAAGFSESEILAIANNRAEFRRLAKEEVKDLVGDTIALLEDRLNKSGMTELNIVKAGDNEIEVKLPALPPSELAAIKSTLSTTGRLEFILLPDKKIFGTKKASEVYPALPEKEAHRHRWYDVDPSVVANALFGSSQLTYDSDRGGYVEISKRGKDSNPAFHAETWTVVLDAPAVETKFQDKDGREHKAWITPEKILVQTSYPDPDNPSGDLRGYPVKGTSLKSATASSDSNTGRPAVSFELGGQGVAVMETVTAAHNEEDNVNADDHRNLAVAIDKAVYSAPSINARLSDRIQVSGSFTRAEVAQYVAILKSGSLSVELTPLGEESIGPAEGQDNINRGMWSLFLGAGLVLLFALFFYRRTGALTVLNLILTIVLILAIMSLFLSTLTLPGIAGLVLTLGMAIDANILINERIREERANGVSPRTAIELGFKKAFSAIMDGNVTTLITALILTKIGTGAVAGFALTLSIGIICTLYTALLVYRTTLFFCFDKGIIPDVTGAKLFQGTNFNILSVGKKLTVVNFILMIGAFSFFVWDAADGDVFGIDFRGGSQLVIQLNEGMTRESLTDDYLKKIEVDGQQKYKDIQVQARSFLDTDDEATGGPTRWEVRIPQPAGEALDGEAALRRLDEIEADVRAILAGKLVPEGYNLAVTSPKAVDFEVQLKLLRPADMTKERESENWLNFVTQGEFHTEDDGIDKWFTFTGTKAFEHHLDGVSQVVTFASRDINAGTPQEVENNWKTFYDVIAAKFAKYPKAKEIIEGGFPAFRTFDEVMRTGRRDLKDDGLYGYARRADIKATISLLRPLAIETFRAEFAKQQQLSTNDWVKFLGPEQIVAAEGSSDPNNASIYVINGTNVSMFDFDEVLKSRTNDVDVALETLIAKLDDSLRENPEIETGVTAPIPRSSVIGGRIAGETQARALLALLIALIAIVIYIGIRFKSAGWGYAAVAALVHDTMFTLGAIAVIDYTFGHQLGFDLKIDLNAIAALLTVIGYSLNDTIVIFDRIREELVDDLNAKKERPMGEVINAAINRTLSRTMLTSISTFVVVLAMVFLGGPAIRTFAWTLLFGLIFGTYSSVFRAGPFLLLFTGRSGDLREEIRREEEAKAEARRAEEEALAQISTDQEYDEADFQDAEVPSDDADTQGSKEESSEGEEKK